MRVENDRLPDFKDEDTAKVKKLIQKQLIEEQLKEIKALRAAFAKW